MKVFKFHCSVLFQFVLQPTFGFAFLGELYDKYKGNHPVSLSNSSASVTTSV